MKRRPPAKSRVPAERVRVIIHPPSERDGYAEPPGYVGHHGGSFHEAGYSTGRGQFGFRHDTIG